MLDPKRTPAEHWSIGALEHRNIQAVTGRYPVYLYWYVEALNVLRFAFCALRFSNLHPSLCPYFLVVAILLTSCATPIAATPPALPVPTALTFTQLEALPVQGNVSTLGYLLITTEGAILAPAAGFSAATPVALGALAEQIWCGDGSTLAIEGALATTGGVRYGVVLATGTLDTAEGYGPAAVYSRQLRNIQVHVVNPTETTIVALRENTGFYNQRVVRIVGWILLSSGSSVLVDTIGQGGVPQPGAVSLKLRYITRDPGLEATLQMTSNGAVRYGQVQIEGYMQAGTLVPLAIRRVGR